MVEAVTGVIGAAMGIGTSVAEAVPTHRQCTIVLKNRCTEYSLYNPRMFFESGGCAIPPSPFIASSESDTFLFIKTPNTAHGSVGVFTYDLLHKGGDKPRSKIAVMFSVPFDFIEYYNCYAVGLFAMDKQCDVNLYHEMYNAVEVKQTFVRGKACDPCLIYKGCHVTIMATMSDAYQPVMKVQVTDTV